MYRFMMKRYHAEAQYLASASRCYLWPEAMTRKISGAEQNGHRHTVTIERSQVTQIRKSVRLTVVGVH